MEIVQQIIKLSMLIVSQYIQTLVMIIFDGYNLNNTYSDMTKKKKNKKDKAVSYLKDLYRR
jgi:hypothetical protein